MPDNNKEREIVNPWSKFWLEEQKVLTQTQKEYTDWYGYIVAKREQRRKDLRNLYVPATKTNKVNVNSVYTTMQTLMSVYYNDKMIVAFQWRKSTDAGKAENLNKLADYDYDVMELDKVDYEWNWDRFFFWVGIKLIDGWDKVTNTPIARTITPLAWIPDARGWFTIESHRYAGFEVEMTKAQMNQLGYANVALVNAWPETEQSNIRNAYMLGRDLINLDVESTPNQKYDIYHHYTIIWSHKYLVTTANYRSVILKVTRLEAVSKEEKDNPLKVPFPIALKYYSPVKGDAMWISVPDLLRDKQNAESKLFNLAIIKETRNALWEDLYYDGKMIKDAKNLTRPTINPKAIPVNVPDGKSLAQSVFRAPKEGSTQWTFNANQNIQFQNSLSTWLDANTLGVQAWAWQTATEAQITQKNANLRFILGTKIGRWGEETFYKLYLRAYALNLKPSSKKVIYVTKTFGSQYFEFKKGDLISDESTIDIKIVSNSERESLQNKEKADFYALAPQILADPTTPEISKLFIKRKMLRLANLSEEEVMIMVPPTVDERLAQLDVELINNGEEPQAILDGQDHLTYIEVYHSANDSAEKYEAITKRNEAYLEEKQRQAKEGAPVGWQQGDNTIGNIAASNASQTTSAQIQDNASWPVWNISA